MSPRAVSTALWVAQILLGITFAGTGVWKLVTPVANLAAVFPWMGQVPEAFMRATGVIDLAGGLGVILPSATRVLPWLTPLAALGCAVLQVCAIVFHVLRGEAANTPFNFFLVGLSVFILWGRWKKAPISPRA